MLQNEVSAGIELWPFVIYNRSSVLVQLFGVSYRLLVVHYSLGLLFSDPIFSMGEENHDL